MLKRDFRRWASVVVVPSLLLVMLAGCASESTESAATSAAGPSAAGQKFLAASEPAGAENIIRVREESKDGDEVTVVGRIGGDVNPWVEGRAVFSLVDLSAKACSDIHGDGCPTPWDYCCDSDTVKKGKALIKLVGDDGKPVATDARELLGVKELDTLVVQGQADRDDAGNLTVLASRIFVRAPAVPANDQKDNK